MTRRRAREGLNGSTCEREGEARGADDESRLND